jgi:hypothetical protein
MASRLIRFPGILLAATLSLSGCVAVMDNIVMSGMDDQTRQLVATHRLGETFQGATDAQAVQTITRSRNPEQITLGAVIGIWDQRPALLEAALSRGLDPNQPIPNRLLVSYPQSDFTRPSPLAAAYALMPPPPMTQLIDHRAQVTPTMLVRDIASFERLVAAGADYNRETLNAALRIATVFAETPQLAERLLHMGGDLTASLHPEIPPMIFSVASVGQPQMMSWLLTQGFDPNSRFSTPANRRVHSSLEGVSIHSYLLDATPLYFLPGYTPDTRSRQRAVEMARVLINAGADINATATFSYSVPDDQPIADWTPLHTYHMPLNQPYGNPDLVNFLISMGANPQALTSRGQAPEQVTGMMERTLQQVATLDSQHRREREQRAAQAKQQQQTDSGNLFGQAIAIAGLATVGTAASNAGVDSSAVMQIVGGGIADVMTEGRAGGIQQAQQQLQQQQATQTNTAARSNTTAALAPAPGFQTETYRVTCPSGVSNDIPLHYRTQQCRTAMIDFARTYSCNDYKRFDQVHAACESACGSVNCLQE